MKKIILILISFLPLLMLYLLIHKHKTIAHNQDTLIIGTNAEFPPFSFINPQGEIVGFDIDLINEIAKRMDKKIELKDVSFEMLIPEAQIGSIHVIAAGMTATPERAQQIIFARPHLKGDSLVVLTLKQNPITKIEDLYGKDVIVNEGYTADAYISALPQILVKRLPAPAESMLDLMTGKSFAYASATNAIKPFLKQYGQENFNIFPIAGTQENTAIGISKKYPELLDKVQPILDQMESDGTIQALKTKWEIS